MAEDRLEPGIYVAPKGMPLTAENLRKNAVRVGSAEPVEGPDQLQLELLDDPGWWRVAWPNRSLTYFRDRDAAVALQQSLHGTAVYVEWVQELP